MHAPDPKYKVKEGDTIQKINKLFGINQDVWVRYHNSKVYRLDQSIGNDLPPGLEEIYLMPALWAEADEFNYVAPVIPKRNREPANLHLLDELFYLPSNFCNRYGVVFHLQKAKIHYEIECAYKGMVSDGVFQMAIDRKQVYVNDKKPVLKLYEMADQLSKAVYPLLLDINSERKIEKIANHNEIVQRCKDAQMKLLQYYVGENAEEYFRLFEEYYDNPNNLIHHIENELFYQLFFLPIQGPYENLQKRIQFGFSQGINNNTTYTLIVTLDPSYTESGKLKACATSEEKQGHDPCFEVEYRLYPEDHTLFSIRGHLVKMDDKQVPVRTDFEIYHLNPEERVIKKSIPGREPPSFDGKEVSTSQKKKSGFWNLFSS